MLPPGDDPSSAPISPLQAKVPTYSGLGQTYFRYPNCFVAVWSNFAGAGPKIYFLRAGTLDRKDLIKPDANIYVAFKQPWTKPLEGIPSFDEFYSYKDHWPKEALDRVMAAKQS
jgi:hypothetical protein